MHELGTLRQIVKIVTKIADEKGIKRIKHITLEVGKASGFVPYYNENESEVPVTSDSFLSQ